MKVIGLVVLVGVVTSASLDNSYLPPNNAGFRPRSNNLGPQPSGGSGSSPSAQHIPILKFAAENEEEGTYRYNYESASGISAEEQGDARGDGTKSHGSYSYTGSDGQQFSITYTADENGFVPHGSHLPTPPPIPEAILKALQENAEAEARGIFDDGQYHGEGLEDGAYHGEGENARSGAGDGTTDYAANGGYRY
ncbi:endocuticle structural glycoprotein SgAbd-2-like [Euwallacea similis]|uniref:endocuticle structural glycoprotein SgAbd-2-like n=1 Tax=Euwallacea similis TaxID=1736056 RepID=UPI00344D532F